MSGLIKCYSPGHDIKLPVLSVSEKLMLFLLPENHAKRCNNAKCGEVREKEKRGD